MISGECPSTENYWEISTIPTSGYKQMPDVISCDICCKLEFKEKIVVINSSTFCEKCAGKYETIIVDENQESEMLATLNYVEEREVFYFKIEDKWYSRTGLETLDKYFDKRTREIVDLSDTGICYQSQNRYLKTEMLVMNTPPNTKRYFMRKKAGDLSETYMHSETYEFYSDQLAERLIAKGDTNTKTVRSCLNNMLLEMKANIVDGQNYIPHIVNKLEVTEGIKGFLKLYIRHFNDGSEYL